MCPGAKEQLWQGQTNCACSGNCNSVGMALHIAKEPQTYAQEHQTGLQRVPTRCGVCCCLVSFQPVLLAVMRSSPSSHSNTDAATPLARPAFSAGHSTVCVPCEQRGHHSKRAEAATPPSRCAVAGGTHNIPANSHQDRSQKGTSCGEAMSLVSADADGTCKGPPGPPEFTSNSNARLRSLHHTRHQQHRNG
jgi:hypothetical protein